MRYLSDDGKVFNTKEECDEWESAQKERDWLKKEEEELKRQNKELKAISDRYNKILNELNNLNKEIDKYKVKTSEAKVRLAKACPNAEEHEKSKDNDVLQGHDDVYDFLMSIFS